MDTHELATLLIQGPRRNVVASVDISTDDDDAGRRAYGELCDLQYEADGNTVTLLFDAGTLNDSV